MVAAAGNFLSAPALASRCYTRRCGLVRLEAIALVREPRGRSHERCHMSKPDGATSAPGSLALGSGSIAAALTAAKPADHPAAPGPRAVAINRASADAPERAVREQVVQHPRLDSDLQAVIGQQLRAVYHEILDEPVPDRFVRLLEQLATKAADRR